MADMPQASPWKPALGVGWGLLTALCCLVYLHASAPVAANDLFWHIKTGEHLVQAGGFPDRDVFSYTAGHLDWSQPEWLAEVLFYGLHELGGFPALRLLTGLLAVGSLIAVLHLARRQIGHGLVAALATMAFAVLATTQFETRPMLFSMALFLALISWLVTHRGRWRFHHAATIVILTLLWVNLHSVGLLAPLVYAAYVLALLLKWFLQRQGQVSGSEDAEGTELGRHAPTLFAVCGVGMFTPTGPDLFASALQDSSWGMGAGGSMTPEAFVTILGSLALVFAIYLLIGLTLRKTSFPDPIPVALALVCVSVGLMSRQFHWMVAIALILSLGLLRQQFRAGRFVPLTRVLRGRAVAAVGAALFLATLGLLYNRELRTEGDLLHRAVTRAEFYQRQVSPALDLPAIQFLRDTGLKGNLFCHRGSGGVLSFHLYPAIKVFLDSRAVLYRGEIIRDYGVIREGRPDQVELLDRYDTDIFFRQPEIAPLVDTRGWILIYRGPDGELWHRENKGWRNLDLCAAYYADRGIPFSRAEGLRVGAASGSELSYRRE